MTGPFAGHGIPTNLNIQKSKLKDDSYFKLLNKVLDGENILNKYSFNDTKKFQEKLLNPYLEFFIRKDNNDYYKKLFFNRGLAKNQKGDLKQNL